MLDFGLVFTSPSCHCARTNHHTHSHTFYVLQIRLQLQKVTSICLIFNSLFLQLPNNHLIASSRLHLCFRASDKMIGWMYVKLLAALILCKSNSKVRVCWKQAKQQTTLEEIKRLCAATSNVLLLNFHYKITNFWFFKNNWLCEETLNFYYCSHNY